MIAGCDAETVAHVRQSVDSDTIWVFAQMNIPKKDGLEDYYYYGRINEEIYHRMIDGEMGEGFILFRDIRYWNDDSKIEQYEDHMESGDLLFRIEHIVKLDLEKGDPLLLEDKEFIQN